MNKLDYKDQVNRQLSPMLRCVANDMNRWEIFPSLLIKHQYFLTQKNILQIS